MYKRISMKYTFLFVFCLPFLLGAQDIKDPKAKLLLDDLSNEFDKHSQLSVDFDLILKFPESLEETQQGKLIQSNDNFYISLDEQIIINNGSEIYMIMTDQNVAQINSIDENASNQDILNPKKLIKEYNSGKYEFAIVGEDKIDNKRVTLIEFKPVDRFSEYSKMRIAIDQSNDLPYYFKIFGKDGSQYTLKMKSFNFNPSIEKGQFEFNKADYEGISVEDLRID